MGRIRLAFALAAVALAGFHVGPAHASRTLDIQALKYAFSPIHQFVDEPNDLIRWTVTGDFHHIVAYAGKNTAGVTYAFQSPEKLSAESNPYVIQFKGGSVYYRCARHSFVTGDNVCSGMCGTLSDRTQAPAPPTITVPGNGEEIVGRPQLVAGTTEPFVLVAIDESEGPTTRLAGQVLSDDQGNWSLHIPLGEGAREIFARATDAAGHTSLDSPVVGFVVTKDATRPQMTQDTPTTAIGVALGTIDVGGTATDNVGVFSIEITLRDILTPGAAQKGYSRTATCTPDCFILPKTLAWEAHIKLDSALNLPSSLYQVQVTVKDGSGLTAQGPVFNVLLLPPVAQVPDSPVPLPTAPTPAVTPLPTVLPSV